MNLPARHTAAVNGCGSRGPATGNDPRLKPSEPLPRVPGKTFTARDPFYIGNYGKEHLIEQIMALEGRYTPCPRKFRDYLEGLAPEKLAARLRVLAEEHSGTEGAVGDAS